MTDMTDSGTFTPEVVKATATLLKATPDGRATILQAYQVVEYTYRIRLMRRAYKILGGLASFVVFVVLMVSVTWGRMIFDWLVT